VQLVRECFLGDLLSYAHSRKFSQHDGHNGGNSSRFGGWAMVHTRPILSPYSNRAIRVAPDWGIGPRCPQDGFCELLLRVRASTLSGEPRYTRHPRTLQHHAINWTTSNELIFNKKLKNQGVPRESAARRINGPPPPARL